MTKIGVALRLMLLGLCGLVLVPLQMLALRFGWSSMLHVLPVWFHRILLKLFNVRVIEQGTPPGEAPTIVVSNHVSWLDIPVIGAGKASRGLIRLRSGKVVTVRLGDRIDGGAINSIGKGRISYVKAGRQYDLPILGGS